MFYLAHEHAICFVLSNMNAEIPTRPFLKTRTGHILSHPKFLTMVGIRDKQQELNKQEQEKTLSMAVIFYLMLASLFHHRSTPRPNHYFFLADSDYL